MAQLAIKGHPTRGKEVIQLLKMLGGENKYYAQGNCTEVLYFIYDNKGIKYLMESDARTDLMKVFTLEEFEEKFPYKVGDKVITDDKFIGTITDIKWQGDIVYTVQVSTTVQITYPVAHLQPCKEETLQERIDKSFEQLNQKIFQAKECACNIRLELIKEENIEGVYAYNEINCYHQDFGDKVRIRLGNDFEIKVEDNITYIVKKQSQYPKNYEECCGVLGYEPDEDEISCYQGHLIESFVKLLICRDAYWKMGLGKSWKPDWRNYEEQKYCIKTDKGEITLSEAVTGNKILAFPTKKIRDAFYENFRELIKQCKELL